MRLRNSRGNAERRGEGNNPAAGFAGAHADLMALAGRLKAPIVHAMRGKEFIEPNNPYDVGMTGLLGFSSGYRAMMACDTLLMLGTDFPYTQFFPETAKIIQIDIRGEQIGRRTRVDLGTRRGRRRHDRSGAAVTDREGRSRTHLDDCSHTT